MIHSVDFSAVPDMREYLTKNKHWVYCSNDNEEWTPNDVINAEIYKRISKDNKGSLVFHRLSKDPNDGAMRPRIEIVPVFGKIEKHNQFHVRYEVAMVKGKSTFRGMIFQLMDHESNNGKALPVFQLEIRDKKLHTRWTIVKDGKNINTMINNVYTPKWTGNDWMNVDIYGVLSHDENEGYIRVYLNDVFAWERHGENASEFGGDVQIQYGIYAVKGSSLKTRVRHLSWGYVETIPQGNNLDGEYRPNSIEKEKHEDIDTLINGVLNINGQKYSFNINKL